MKRIVLYSTLFIVVSMGCTDLNEELYSGIPDEEYPQTPGQANAIPLESLSAMADLFDDNGYWYLSQELSSDELVGPTRAADWFDGGKWLQLQYHTWTDGSDAVKGMWPKLWQGIGQSNQIIDKIGVITSSNEMKSKADVETVRSLYYFWLIDNYGDVPYLTSFSSAPEKPFRITRSAIFDSLTTTLEYNYPLMSSVVKSGYKMAPSKELALTLLAKLYLNGAVYKGSENPVYYEKTIQYCDSLLSYSYLGLENNVMNLFKRATSAKSKEMIFMIPFDETTKQGFRFHMRTLGYISKLTFNMSSQPWNGFAAIPTFFDKYEDTDVRKRGYFLYGPQVDYLGAPLIDTKTKKQVDFDPYIKFPWMSIENMNNNMTGDTIDNFEMTYCGARVQKYEVYAGALDNLTVNFPVFRLADVVFMKAEAELRLNGTVSAETMVLVNQIWSRANATPPAEGLTLANILDERGKELFCEGHRRTDQIRFGTFDKPFWAMGQTDMTGVPAPNAIQNIFPIPASALASNPNLGLAPQ